MLERLSCNSSRMGSGASVLSNNMAQYAMLRSHVKLSRPGRPFDGHVVIITVMRIPEVVLQPYHRQALLDAAVPHSGIGRWDDFDDYQLDYHYDYDDSDTESRIAESRQF